MRQKISVLFILFSLLFLTGCATLPTEQQKEADFHKKMGIAYLNEGNLQMAFIEFQKAYQIDPDDKETLHGIGLVHFQLEEFEKAKENFLKAVSIDPEFSEAYNNLGVTYMRTGQWQSAVEAFKKALSNPLYRTPEKAFYSLGMSYYRLGQYNLAIDAFKDAIKRDTLSPSPYYGLALAYNKLGRYGDAAAVISKALETDQNYKGDRTKFIEDLKQKLPFAKGEDEKDSNDYLEIMRY